MNTVITCDEVFTTKPRYQKTLRKATKMYLRLQDKKEVMDKCGDAALILYEFYVSKAGTPDYPFSDDLAAKALGWNVHKIKRNRLALAKSNYFKQINGKLNDGRKVTVTYLEPEYIAMVNACTKQEQITKLLESHVNHSEGAEC